MNCYVEAVKRFSGKGVLLNWSTCAVQRHAVLVGASPAPAKVVPAGWQSPRLSRPNGISDFRKERNRSAVEAPEWASLLLSPAICSHYGIRIGVERVSLVRAG